MTAWMTDPPTAAHARPQCTRRHSTRRKKKVDNASPRWGGLTCRSRCFRCHRRPWRNCARARRHARTQADADAGAHVEHAQREGGGSARTPSARDHTHPDAKQKSTRFAAMGELTLPPPRWKSHRRPWRHFARACRRARTHADADAGQTSSTAWLRQLEGPTHRRQRTHTLSARDDIHPGAKQKSTTLHRDGGTHVLLALFTLPPPTVAELCPCMQACTHTGMHAHRQTQTPAPTPNTRGGDSVRDRPTDGSTRTPSVHATTFTPAQNKTQHALPRWGDSLDARCVRLAAADRGVTALAHTGMHAHSRTQTPAQKSNTRGEGPSHRHQNTHTLSARDDIHPGAKQKSTRFPTMGGTHLLLALLLKPPPTVAKLRSRTPA
jgi:hypothetical protein